MRRRQKKGSFARSHLGEAWFEFGMLKAILLVLLLLSVCPTRDGTDFAQLHTDPFEKGTNLGRTASNASQVLNGGLCLGNGARGMGTKVGF